eukprot:6596097-Prymnesium_polylepis.2
MLPEREEHPPRDAAVLLASSEHPHKVEALGSLRSEQVVPIEAGHEDGPLRRVHLDAVGGNVRRPHASLGCRFAGTQDDAWAVVGRVACRWRPSAAELTFPARGRSVRGCMPQCMFAGCGRPP